MRIAVRGFSGDAQLFEEILDIEPDELGETAEAYIGRLPAPHNLGQLLEVEFLDEIDPLARLLRYVPFRVPS